MVKTTLGTSLGFFAGVLTCVFISFASKDSYRHVCEEYSINPYLVESIYEYQTNRFKMDKNNISALLVDYAETGADVGDGIRAIFPSATAADIESICLYAEILEKKN